MWSLLLTNINTFSSPVLLQRDTGSLSTKIKTIDRTNLSNLDLLSFDLTQTPQDFNLVEAASPSGFLLKYSPLWQRYAPQNSNSNADILLARNFPSPKGDVTVKITTTAINFIGVPKNLPKNTKKIDISAEFFARVLSQTGYKVYQVTEVMINEKKGFKIVTETPKKLGSTIVLLEGKGETMVVSTSTYPIDTSIISSELLEQVLKEIGVIQNSIFIR